MAAWCLLLHPGPDKQGTNAKYQSQIIKEFMMKTSRDSAVILPALLQFNYPQDQELTQTFLL